MTDQPPSGDGSPGSDPFGPPGGDGGAPGADSGPQAGQPYAGQPYGSQVPYGAPPQQYGAPPQQYGAYAYGPPQYEHPQGTTILILGILGIVLCQLCAPFAWVMGNRVLAEIDANPTLYSNRSLVVAGRICGIVGTVIFGVYLVGIVLYLAVVAVAIGSSA